MVRVCTALLGQFVVVSLLTAAPPIISVMPVVSGSGLRADGATAGTVSTTVSDPDGTNDTRDCRVLLGDPEAIPRIYWMNSRPFNPGVRGQNPYRSIPASGYETVWTLGQGASGRGLAGGLDADTYDWRDINSGCNWGLVGGHFTTLEFLQYARDHAATPLLTANLFGGGAKDETGTFVCATDNPEGLAADWVRYTNIILQQYRQGQESSLAGEDLRVYNSIVDWEGRPRLLAAGEAITPRVQYWEIGNEPELGAIDTMLSHHYLGPAEYRDRFKLMSAAMRAVDPTLKIGPCLMTPSPTNNSGQWLDTLAADPDAQIDFIGYHPYYSDIRNNWNNPAAMTAALRKLKSFLAARAADARAIMNAHGRTNYELMATEWNPVNWDAPGEVQRSMANALAVTEGVFSFAEDGISAAHFWEQPQGKLGAAGAYTGLAAHMGDILIPTTQDFGVDPDVTNWRIYVTRNSADPDTMMIWGLNFNEDTPVEMQLSLGACRVNSAILKRYGKPGDDAAGGDTSLLLGTGMAWEQTDITAGFDPQQFTLRMEDAEITVLILQITRFSVLDHDRDGDMDMEDFGWFQSCLTGAGKPQNAPECVDARLDDEDVDSTDLLRFMACLGGAGVPASPTCDQAP